MFKCVQNKWSVPLLWSLSKKDSSLSRRLSPSTLTSLLLEIPARQKKYIYSAMTQYRLQKIYSSRVNSLVWQVTLMRFHRCGVGLLQTGNRRLCSSQDETWWSTKESFIHPASTMVALEQPCATLIWLWLSLTSPKSFVYTSLKLHIVIHLQ